MKISTREEILKELSKRDVPVMEALTIFDGRKLHPMLKRKEIGFINSTRMFTGKPIGVIE